jgi:hypothetical protein
VELSSLSTALPFSKYVTAVVVIEVNNYNYMNNLQNDTSFLLDYCPRYYDK